MECMYISLEAKQLCSNKRVAGQGKLMCFVVNLNDAVIVLWRTVKNGCILHTLAHRSPQNNLAEVAFLGMCICLPIYMYQQLQNIYFVLVPVCCNMDTLLYTGLGCVPFCVLILHSNNLL